MYMCQKGQGVLTSKVWDTRYLEVPHSQGVKRIFWPKFVWYIPHDLEIFSNDLQWPRLHQSVLIPNMSISDWFRVVCCSSHIDHVSRWMSVLCDCNYGKHAQPVFTHSHCNDWLIWVTAKLSTQSFSHSILNIFIISWKNNHCMYRTYPPPSTLVSNVRWLVKVVHEVSHGSSKPDARASGSYHGGAWWEVIGQWDQHPNISRLYWLRWWMTLLESWDMWVSL